VPICFQSLRENICSLQPALKNIAPGKQNSLLPRLKS